MTRKHAHENTDFPGADLCEAIQDVSMQSFFDEQNLVGGILAGTVTALVFCLSRNRRISPVELAG